MNQFFTSINFYSKLISIKNEAGNKMIIDDVNTRDEIIKQNQRLVQNLNTQRHTVSGIRQLISEITGQKIDESIRIALPFYTDYGRNIKLGKRVNISCFVTMRDLGGIIILDDVQIGPGVVLDTVTYPENPQKREQPQGKGIKIEKNALIEPKAVIMPGVIIGENSIVKAGAIVEEDVPANTIAAGNPAKVIKKLKK